MYISRSLKFIIDNNDNNINDEYPCIYILFFAEKWSRNKEKSKGDGRRDKRLISGGSTQRGSRAQDPCIDVHGVKKNATTLNVRSDQLESYSSPFIFR